MNKMRSFQKSAFCQSPSRKHNLFKIRAILVVLPFLCLFLTIPTLAQKTSGQLSGSIVDQSGAALPETNVTVTQLGTGFERTVTTSSEGVYTISDLPIGTYRLAATKTGFKSAIAENVVINVATVTRQDLTLEVGSIDQQVTITADTIQVETQTGAIGEVVTGQQVRELPLNGRSFVQLTQLQPGVAPQNNFDSKNKGLFSGVDFSVNGNSAQSNLFLTDGANNNDTGSNRTILLYPSIEAIAEFKMLRNSYGPEYGQAAGSIISIATRSGENQFHGSLFYFGRNDALNATEFFANRGGVGKDKLRRNDFGFSIGGPIPIFNFGEGGPMFKSGKDRLFFFYSQEWNKEIRGGTRSGNVPTLAERNGNFTDASRSSCNGGATGTIPQSQLSPAGQALLNLYPLPNQAQRSGSCDNWSQSLAAPIDFRQENIRIDANINKKNQIFGRYTQDHWANPFPILFGAGLWGDDPFPTVESDWAQPSRQAAFKLTSTLSNTAVNEVQFSYSANRINIVTGSGSDIKQAINTAIPTYFPSAEKVNGLDRPHPVFWGGIQAFTSNRGPDLWTQAPFRNSLDIYAIRDDFSKVAGNHTFKTGFLFDKATKREDAGPNNEVPQFWGQPSITTILTRGSFIGFSESDRQAVGNTKYSNLEFYLGDTWKVRPNVTLELGARYSMFFEPYDEFNRISSFNPARYNPARPATDPCNGLVVPKGSGNICASVPGASAPTEASNRSLRKNNYKNLAPRLGVAWDVTGKGTTAIRAGFGQFFLRERVSPIVAALTSNPPFIRSIGGQRTLDGPAQFRDLPASAGFGSPAFSLDPRAATPYSYQFNVTVDQEIFKGAVLEVAYVGNRARNQLTQFDLNAVLPQNRVAAAFAANADAVNVFRPFRNYGSIYQWTRRGRADYDSLQMLFKTRILKNSQIQVAYTFSKSQADFGLGDSSGGRSPFALQDINNPDLDFGPSDINRPHLFVANTIINLPSFKNLNPVARTFLGGWEFATIVQLTSGTSLTPTIGETSLSYDLDGPGPGTETRNFQAGFTGTGTGVANQRPNFTGGSCLSDNADATQFLSPNAYTLVGTRIGQLNDSRRGSCLGSPIRNVDASIYKNFSPSWLTNSFLGEGARIQFRLETFNLFNQAQFRGDAIGVNYYNGQVVCGNAACSPTNNTITGITGTPQPNFGFSGNTRGAREIQYALKLVF